MTIEAPTKTTTVLLVDDDPEVRIIMKRTLEVLFDYHVVTAIDGLDSISATQEFQPDVILMDLAMPNMDGLEATHTLKGQDATRHIPIIVCSNYAGVLSWRQQAEKAGCARCIEKLVSPDELHQMIRDVLEEAKN